MRIDDLRALAAYHRETAECNRKLAEIMNAEGAKSFLLKATTHAEWAQKLDEMAAAFAVIAELSQPSE